MRFKGEERRGEGSKGGRGGVERGFWEREGGEEEVPWTFSSAKGSKNQCEFFVIILT